MTTRTLRRRVIIREYDFEKVKNQAIGVNYYFNVGNSLYDRAEFIPLNQDTLEKLKLTELLKGKTGPLTEVRTNMKNPALLLYNLKDYLYDQKYFEWNVDLDDEGYICVQARKNTPRTRIGWAIFEKEIVCRI
jgi:hypothetical protein